MNRSLKQQQRLRFEQMIIAAEMPGFSWTDYGEVVWVTGEFRLDGSYGVRLELPPAYPLEQPELYITDPSILPKHGSGTINEIGASSEYCTRRSDGCVRVCHSDRWDGTETAVKVLMKGNLWLHAYELHLSTGEPIGHFLNHGPFRS